MRANAENPSTRTEEKQSDPTRAERILFKELPMHPSALAALLFLVLAVPPWAAGAHLIDMLWVWGIPEGNGGYEMGKGRMLSTTDPAAFAQADAQSKAAILGIPNVLMAGDGLPNDLRRAGELSRGIAGLKRIGWELGPDGGDGPPFVYTEKIAILKKLKQQYPRIEAVSIDDMLTSQRKKGLHPDDIATLRRQLHASVPGVSMWGIVYTMNLADPVLPEYLKSIDVVNLWTWRADELRDLDAKFAAAEKLAGGKPIVLGLYLYDYGGHRKMPPDLLQLQCEKALALARQKRIRGIVFLAVNNDAGAVTWTRDWIRKVRDQAIP
jgi:hypothetical protein